jgi:hypothetical protein
MSSRVLVALASILMSSCTSVVKVKQGETKLSGIPFFMKNEVFRQVTVNRETWYRLTLKLDKKLVETKDGKEVLLDRGTQSFVAEAKDINDKQVIAIKSAILRADTSNVDDAIQLIKDFQAIPSRGVATNLSELKNDIASEWVVDDTKVYYLNAPLPWFGTGNLTQKLNPDGTMSEVTSNPDTKLSEGISALLPVKEYLSGEFIDPAPAAASDPNKISDVQKGARMFLAQGGTRDLKSKQFVYLISLSTDEIGYEVTLQGPPQDKRPSLGKSLVAGDAGVSIERKPVPVEEKTAKDETPTIGISGSIKLPKEK